MRNQSQQHLLIAIVFLGIFSIIILLTPVGDLYKHEGDIVSESFSPTATIYVSGRTRKYVFDTPLTTATLPPTVFPTYRSVAEQAAEPANVARLYDLLDQLIDCEPSIKSIKYEDSRRLVITLKQQRHWNDRADCTSHRDATTNHEHVAAILANYFANNTRMAPLVSDFMRRPITRANLLAV